MEKRDTSLYSDIYNTIYTQAQAHDFISKIDALLFKIYQHMGNVEEHLDTIFDKETAAKIRTQAASSHVDISNYVLFQKFLLEIKEQIMALSSITLFLAFEPQDVSLKKFSDYFMKAWGRKFLFRIEVKKEIIGGAVIVFNGTYRDYSLKSKLKKITQEMDTVASSISPSNVTT